MVSAYARALMLSLIALLTVLLVAGTFVTAAGPHAGDARTPRLMVPVETLAHIHAAVLYVFLGVLVLLGLALRASGADTKVRRPYLILLLVVVAQGSIGLVQFATGVPEALVSLHVLGAVLVVVCCATLWAATRDRGPLPSPGLPPAESLTLAA
jgi:cytochrome c oxidase assembly protein subunit 15